MSVVTERVHPLDAATAAGREPFKVKDLLLADFGRQEGNPLATGIAPNDRRRHRGSGRCNQERSARRHLIFSLLVESGSDV